MSFLGLVYPSLKGIWPQRTIQMPTENFVKTQAGKEYLAELVFVLPDAVYTMNSQIGHGTVLEREDTGVTYKGCKLKWFLI